MADKGMYPPGTPEQPSTPGVVVRAPPARARRGAARCACYRAGDLRHCGTARALCAPFARADAPAARASEGRLASEAGRGKARPGGPGCARCALCAHADTALTNTATIV